MRLTLPELRRLASFCGLVLQIICVGNLNKNKIQEFMGVKLLTYSCLKREPKISGFG